MKEEPYSARSYLSKKIWIDLDNSPHVPFFFPIIRELQKRGFIVILTARDCFQVCGLADLYNLRYRKVGRHYGKNRLLKIFGTFYRSMQLLSIGLKENPSLTVSHGSRSLLIASKILKIPSVTSGDYEHANRVGFVIPDWAIVPEIVSKVRSKKSRVRFLTYPGIKEDVFIHEFIPNPDIRNKLKLKSTDIIATIRPPASEAHYHNPESDKLYEAVVEMLGDYSGVKMVILPRNEEKQTNFIRKKWPKLVNIGKIIIPNRVVNGLDLIWYSDLVISGGGSMNREAASLGVPTYSIFRGKIGVVDRYLSESGRLTLIETVDELRRKIKIARRKRPDKPKLKNADALGAIVDHLIGILKGI